MRKNFPASCAGMSYCTHQRWSNTYPFASAMRASLKNIVSCCGRRIWQQIVVPASGFAEEFLAAITAFAIGFVFRNAELQYMVTTPRIWDLPCHLQLRLSQLAKSL